MRQLLRTVLVSLFVLGCFVAPAMNAAQAPGTAADREFTETVRPFLTTYCASCHTGEKAAAQLDLRQYTSAESVVQDYARWNRLREKLASQQMPPRQAKQPEDAARRQVIAWIDAAWKSEAQRNDGDPGTVLARRLSNAEYNYTIQDLTGVDIRPAREFPVDPANLAGFDNSGESLTMSPALLTKYLQAARLVADHMFLTPAGFEFAPHPMLVETDREKFCIQQIVDFYDRQPTDYSDYFRTAWMYKHRAAFGRPRASLADMAAQSKVSARYLATIWEMLEGTHEEVGPIAKLQTMWRALPVPAKGSDPFLDQFIQMRDFVLRMRKDTAMKFASPVVRGLSVASQPLMNWKNRQYATHRRDFERSALRVADEPPPVEVKMPEARRGLVGGGQNGEDLNALYALAEQYQSRMKNPDLEVPAGQRARYEAAFARFSAVFPDTFYVRERGRFYPDDTEDKGRLLSAGFHNVMGYTRDDAPLSELLLDESGRKELEALWDEFEFVAGYTARTYIEFFFNQSGEVLGNGRESGSHRPADKDIIEESVILDFKKAYLAKAAEDDKNNPIAFEAISAHFESVNRAIRTVERKRLEAEPHQIDAVLAFAARAYRRPLSAAERDDLRGFYRTLREKGSLTHEEAMRDLIVNVLMSPHFTFLVTPLDSHSGRPEATRRAGAGTARAASPSAPLSDYALASRLSYFLWSSMPDAALSARAAAGDLHNEAVLLGEVRRMLKDERAGRLATEFGGNWLDFRRFDEHNAVDRERFPQFSNELRDAMFQEPIRFIADVVRTDRPVLDMLYGTYTFVNPVLARHYGMPEVYGSAERWVRVDNARAFERGGLLPMAAFLTQNAPGLRTSPVKRGYWVARRVLGEVIPPPPPTVPELPKDEATLDLPLRDMLARHRENTACSSCHARFDSFGLTFEGYGPVGETRTKDLAGRAVDTQAVFPGGSQGTGLAGLQSYIRAHRESDFLDNLSRKMLVYALGRSLILSDEPLVERMNAKMAANKHRFGAFVETIVMSPQFLRKRT
jgi:cytochrome c553